MVCVCMCMYDCVCMRELYAHTYRRQLSCRYSSSELCIEISGPQDSPISITHLNDQMDIFTDIFTEYISQTCLFTKIHLTFPWLLHTPIKFYNLRSDCRVRHFLPDSLQMMPIEVLEEWGTPQNITRGLDLSSCIQDSVGVEHVALSIPNSLPNPGLSLSVSLPWPRNPCGHLRQDY